MGVKGLFKLIAPAAKPGNIVQYQNTTLVIDANIFMYSFCYKNNDPVASFKKQIATLSAHQIKPVYVFDGKPHDLKRKTLEKRRKLKEAGALKVSYEQYNQVIQYFTDEGIVVVRPEFGDAEKHGARMVQAGEAAGMITNDADSFAFGCPTILTHFDYKTGNLIEYTLENVLSFLGLTHAQLVDYVIMIGCDFCDGVPGKGLKRALDFLKNKEDVCTLLDPDLVQEVRKIFCE